MYTVHTGVTHFLRIGKLLPRPRSPQTSLNRFAQSIWRAQASNLRRFPARKRYSSLQVAYLRPNRSHKTRYRSNLNRQVTNDHLHECCVLVPYWWYWHHTGTSAYSLVVHILNLIKYEHFNTYDDDGHRVYFL